MGKYTRYNSVTCLENYMELSVSEISQNRAEVKSRSWSAFCAKKVHFILKAKWSYWRVVITGMLRSAQGLRNNWHQCGISQINSQVSSSTLFYLSHSFHVK